MRSGLLLLLGVVACSGTRSAGGIPEPGSPVDPHSECQTVEQILSPAHPEPHAARYLKRVHACPYEAGDAIAIALDTLRTSSDIAGLQRVADLTQFVHHASIFEVSLDIATDRSANLEARIFAFRSLIWSMAPAQRLNYEHMMMSPPEAKCGPGSIGICSSTATGHFYSGYFANSLRWPSLGDRLPTDFLTQVGALCAEIGDDGAEPEPVRLAALHTCWWKPDPELLDLIENRPAPPRKRPLRD